MTLWMKVTDDKYELPIAVADSREELAKMCGTRSNVISSSICHARKGDIGSTCFVKVEVEDEDV